MAEFGPAILLLVSFIIVPSFLALYFTCAALVSYLAVSESAQNASLQGNYTAALAAAKSHAMRVSSTGLAQALHLKNEESEGAQLFIEVTNLKTGQTTEVGPNIPLKDAADPNLNLYQIEARSTFSVGPLLPVGGSPSSSNGLPLLNQPVHLSFSVRRPTEYPIGLSSKSL